MEMPHASSIVQGDKGTTEVPNHENAIFSWRFHGGRNGNLGSVAGLINGNTAIVRYSGQKKKGKDFVG